MIDEKEAMDIAEKEIRGVSLKTLYGLIIGTATIVITVFGTYSSLSGQIKNTEKDRVNDNRYNDLRIQILQEDLKSVKLQIQNLERTINSEDIKDLKKEKKKVAKKKKRKQA